MWTYLFLLLYVYLENITNTRHDNHGEVNDDDDDNTYHLGKIMFISKNRCNGSATMTTTTK